MAAEISSALTTDLTAKSSRKKIMKRIDAVANRIAETSFPERISLLRKVASLMRDKKEMLAKLITLEMGELISQAGAET